MTRPLTLDEIQARGIVIDPSNFTVVNFTAVVGTTSNPVAIEFPVAIPTTPTGPSGGGGGDFQLPSVSLPSPQLPNLVARPITFVPVLDLDPDEAAQLPPIPALLVFPGNIGFLHQFFQALLIVTNGAPATTPLVVADLSATVQLPPGEDRVPGTDEAPGDDPLRVARIEGLGFVRTLPVKTAGPDGRFGTADDGRELAPQVTGQADFSVEGRKEGVHEIGFEITGTLLGLPRGPVPIVGRARGAILVRNPNFALTLSHPSVVRRGESYDLFATITNTSQVDANLVSISLDPLAVSGATLLSGSRVEFRTIAAGESATATFRLQSQRTGQVTATSVASADGVLGRFTLRAGVGELGIPLSPDTLVLPTFGDALPADLMDAAMGLLGQAYSVATAPEGALPPTVARIPRETVTQMGTSLSEAALRVQLGEPLLRSVSDLALDFLGSDLADAAFDSLRRRSTQGVRLAAAIGSIFGGDAIARGRLDFQASLASAFTSRAPHLGVVAGASGTGAGLRVRITDDAGRSVGTLLADTPAAREIPYADRFPLQSDPDGSTLDLVARLDAVRYTIEAVATIAGSAELGIVFPGAAGLEQARFPAIAVEAGSRLTLTLLRDAPNIYALSIDDNGDGRPDRTLAAAEVRAIPDPGPEVVSVVQIVNQFPVSGVGGGSGQTLADEFGRLVAVLFSERVDGVTALDAAHYVVEANAIASIAIQPSGRLVVLRLRDPIGPFVPRSVTVADIRDARGRAMSPASVTRPIVATIGTEGAILSGTVRAADGLLLAGAIVSVAQQVDDPFWGFRSETISSKPADAEGRFQFDFIASRQPFDLSAVSPDGRDRTALRASTAQAAGPRMHVELVVLGRGSVAGVVRDATGAPVAGAVVSLQSVVSFEEIRTQAAGDGSYQVSRVPVGGFTVTAFDAAANRGFAAGTLATAGSTAAADVTILPAVQLVAVSGQVFRADGATLAAGVPVVLHLARASGGNPLETFVRTDAAGFFAFANLPAGTLSLRAVDTGTGEEGRATVTLAPGATGTVTILFAGSGTVNGQVLRANGLPVPGATVVSGPTLVVADSAGRFTIPNVPVGSRSVSAQDPVTLLIGSATANVLTSGDVVQVTVVLPAVGTLTGFVFQADGVTPATGAQVRIIADGGFFPAAVDTAGRYVYEDRPVGTYEMVAIDGLFSVVGTATILVDGQVVRKDFILPVGRGTVTGTVLDEGSNNQPVAATVSLKAQVPDAFGRPQLRPFASTVSDPATGRYTFTGVPLGPVQVTASSLIRPSPASASGMLVTNGETLTVAPLVLKANVGSISGTVLGTDGSPVGAGISVSVQSSAVPVVTVTTNASGTFAFAPILPQDSYTLTAEHPVTGLKGQMQVAVTAGRDVVVTPRLLGKGSVLVTVRQANGGPVLDGSVDLAGGSFLQDRASAVLTPTMNGQVRFTNITEGPVSVSASDANGLRGLASGTLTGAELALTVTLRASGRIVGRFLTPSGLGVAGAQITLSGPQQAFTTTSGDPATAGRFEFPVVPIGAYSLEGFDPATGRRGTASARLDVDGQTVTVDFFETSLGTVTGTLFAGDQVTPVTGASVTISPTGPFARSAQTQSGPDGSFTFPGVSAGGFTVTATDPVSQLGGSATGALTAEGETVTVSVVLQASGRVEGRVVRADGLTPVANAQVTLSHPAAKLTRVTQADLDGRYAFTLVPVGDVSLHAQEPAGIDIALGSGRVNAQGDVLARDLVLIGTGRLTGTLRDADGVTPVASATVTFKSLGQNPLTVSVATAADGSFEFDRVPVGSFSLTARTVTGLGTAGQGSIPADGASVVVSLVLEATGSVVGLVRLPDGVSAARGVSVTLSSAQITAVSATDNTGAFAFQSIPLGSFRLDLLDPFGGGIQKAAGSLTVNGQTFDAGALVLDDRPPAVAAVSPIDGAVNVPVSGAVTITFSEPIVPSTVTSSSVRVLVDGAAVAGTRTLAAGDSQVVFTPAQPLRGYKRYTVQITTAVTDLVGRALPAQVVSSFTTIDNIPPTVVAFSPANGAIQVAPEAVVRVTFSEAIDPASATAGAITLTGPEGPVAGRTDLILNGTVLVFTPNLPLAPNARYTVTLASLRDVAGNALPAPAPVTFATIDTVPPMVVTLALAPGARTIQGLTVTVVATTADTDVAFVDVFADGVLTGTDTTAPYAVPLVLLPKVTPTQIVVTAVAQDKVGNRGPAATLVVPVEPPPPPAAVAAIDPATVNLRQGRGATLTVHITPAQLGPTVVSLAVSDPSLLVVPASVTVPADTTSASFSVRALAPGLVTVTASANGTSAQASLTLLTPPPFAGLRVVETTQADFAAGTLTGVVAKAEGDLDLALSTGAAFTDSFDRPDGTIGNGWTASRGTWTLASQELRVVTGGSPGGVIAQTGTAGDGYFEVTGYIPNDGGNVGNWIGIQLRKTLAGHNWGQSGYLLYLRANGSLEFHNSIDGVVFGHATGRTPTSRAAAIRFGVLAQGNVFRFYVDGVEVGSWTDPNSRYVSGFYGLAAEALGSLDGRFDGFRVGSPPYLTSGSRVWPALDLSTVGRAGSSRIDWKATTPAGTSLGVEASLDGGMTWLPATSGSSVPGITSATDLAGKSLLVRTSLAGTGAGTPELHEMTVAVSRSVQRRETTQADFAAGTLTNTVAKAEGDLELAETPAATAIFFEDFNRADAASVGNGWVERDPALWDLIGNRARSLKSGASFPTVMMQAGTLQNGYIETVVFFQTSDNIGNNVGIRARATAQTDAYTQSGYTLGVRPDGLVFLIAAPGSVNLWTAFLSSFGIPNPNGPANALRLGLALNGSTLTVFLNGTQLAVVTDTAFPAAGFYGLQANNASSFDARFDDFRVKSAGLQTSGTRISPPLDLSPAGIAGGSDVAWQANVPAGTALTVETSLDGGATWSPATNGGAVAGIARGMDLTGRSLLVRTTLAGPGTVTPDLQELTVTVPPVGGIVDYEETTKEDFEAGTLTNVVAKVEGDLELATKPAYASRVLADGPVGYWRLGETSGTVATDASGNGRNGTYTAGVVLGATSLLLPHDPNPAAMFGNGTRVSLPDIDLPTTLSVEAWIRPAVGGQHAKIVGKHENTTNVQGTLALAGGNPMFELTAGGIYRTVIAPTAVEAGTIAHLVATYDGAAMQLYVNGELVASTPATGAPALNNFGWGIGTIHANATTGPFSGVIDDVALYAKALNAATVRAHYAAQTDFVATGTRVSPPIDLSVVGTARTSTIGWIATTPLGTSVAIETSLNGGATWSPATNGGGVPGFTAGLDVVGTALLVRSTLSGAGPETPELQSLSVTVTGESTGAVAGTVRTATGGLAADIVVELSGSGFVRTTRTNASGQYVFGDVPSGAATVRAIEPRSGVPSTAQVNVAADLTTPQDLTLVGVGAVAVQVNFDVGGPVAAAQVSILEAARGASRAAGSTDAAGGLTIANVAVGPFTVRASHPGDATRAAEAGGSVVGEGTAVPVTVVLPATGTVAGRVAFSNGAAAAGATVEVAGPDVPSRSAQTDASGAYTIAGVPAGRPFTVQAFYASAPEIVRQVADQRLLVDGATLPINLVVPALATARVAVVLNGAPVTGARIEIQDSEKPVLRLAGFTDASGLLVVPVVPEGPFTVVALDASTAPPGLLGSATGVVRAADHGRAIDVSLTLVSLPVARYDASNFLFDFQPDLSVAQGIESVFSGDAGANSRGALLEVVAGGTSTRFSGATIGATEEAGRALVVRQKNLAGLDVTRKVFVPQAGYFARYLEILSNPTSAPITVDVRVVTHLRAASGLPQVVATSSGDALLAVADPAAPDRWVVVDDSDDGDPFLVATAPALGFAFDGPNAVERAGIVGLTDTGSVSAQLAYQWTGVTIPPGGAVAYLHFVVQQTSRAAARASVERLGQLPPEALAGLSPDEIARIRNFAVPAGGTSPPAPLPSLAGAISGRVLAGDGATAVPGAQVRFRSNSPFFGRTHVVSSDAIGSFTLGSSFDENGTSVAIPVAPYTLEAAHPVTGVPAPATTGEFAAGQTAAVRDLVFTNTGVVRGTVQRHTGAAVTGGSLRIAGGSPAIDVMLEIASDGGYLLTGVPAGTLTLTASIPHPQGTGLSGTATASTIAGQTAAVNVPIEPTGTITGTVRTSTGALAVNVTVELAQTGFGRTTRTDAAGQYLFGDVPTGTFTVVARDPGTGAFASSSVSVVQDQTSTSDLSLSTLSTIQARVTFSDGSPAANVSVTIVRSDGFNQTSQGTDALGVATFANVAVGTYTVSATHPRSFSGSASGTVAVQSGGLTVPITLVLPAVGAVTGHVAFPSGTPAANADVRVRIGGSDRGFALTDAAGNYTISNVVVPAGSTFTVVAFRPGTSFSREVPNNTLAEGQTITVDLTLPAVATVHLTVVGTDGLPRAGIPIDLGKGPSPLSSFTRVGATAASGVLDIPNVGEGSFTIDAADPSIPDFSNRRVIGSATGTVLPADDGQTIALTLTLYPVGTVQGAVVAADGQTPVQSAYVELFEHATGRTVADGSTNGAGVYQVSGVRTGPQGLGVRGHAPFDFALVAEGNAVIAIEGETVVANLTLPVSVIKGIVFFSDGVTPVPFPSVFAQQADAAGVVRTFFTNTNDGGGGYSLLGPAVGPFAVTAQDPNTGLTGTATGTLAALAVPAVANVSLQPSGSVTGLVLDTANNAVPFAQVAVTSAGTTFNRFGTADAQGVYRFDRIALGAFTFQAKDPSTGVTTSAIGALASAGETAAINVNLPPTGTVTGTVLDVDGMTPKAGVTATVENYGDAGPLGTFIVRTATSAAGEFQVAGVPVGTARATGYNQTGKILPDTVRGYAEATLAAGGSTAVSIVLGNAVPFGLALNLDGADGFRYDVNCRGELFTGGTVDRRLVNAYRRAALLRVNGPIPPCVLAGRLEDGGREVVIGPAGLGGLAVTRKVFVPSAGRFARYLEILRNPTSAPVTATVEVRSNLGSSTLTRIVVAPSATGNTFGVTDQPGSCCSPALAHVFGGPGGGLAAAATQFENGNGVVFYRWNVTVPAGQSAIVMHFAVQREAADAAGARAQAEALASLTDPDAVVGMSAEERSHVLNFNVP